MIRRDEMNFFWLVEFCNKDFENDCYSLKLNFAEKCEIWRTFILINVFETEFPFSLPTKGMKIIILFWYIFDCCKQSLKRLFRPPIYPPTHPPIQDYTFLAIKLFLRFQSHTTIQPSINPL